MDATLSVQPVVEVSKAPVAVQPHDPDLVFLSKTVVSLFDVFTHAVDTRYDLTPLPTPVSSHLAQEKDLPAKQAACGLPFLADAQPYCASVVRDGQSSTQAAQRYTWVVRNATHSLLHRAPLRQQQKPQRSPTETQPAKAVLTTPTVSRPPPRLLVVPVDPYHLLLSFRDVDPDTLTGILGHSNSRGCGVPEQVTTVQKVSANAAGCRPPRSGLAVVRRLEGELRSVLSNTAASSTTESRVMQGLPMQCFDGWVRDYTVYGMSSHSSVLRAVWADKVRERCGDLSADVRVAGEVVEVTDRPAKDEGSKTSAYMPALPAAPVKDAADPTTVVDAVDAAAAAVSPSLERLVCSSSTATSPRSPSPLTSATSPEEDDGAPRRLYEEKVATLTNRGNTDDHDTAAVAAGGTSTPPEEENTEAASVEEAAPVEATVHCSSVGASTPRSNAEPVQPQALQSSAHEQVEASNADVNTAIESPAALLWDEERRRTATAVTALRHRFLVADAKQHAIWCVQVRLPSMEVQVVAPAEFYTVGEAESGRRRGMAEKEDATGNGGGGENTAGCSAMTPARLPKKKPPTTVTEAARRSPPPSKPSDVEVRETEESSPSPDATEPRGAAAKAGEMEANAEGVSASSRRSRQEKGDGKMAVGLKKEGKEKEDPVSASSSPRTHARSSASPSPSVALAEAVPTPLLGGAKGFVDGHFSVARFHSPGALCWRIDELDRDNVEETATAQATYSSGGEGHAAGASVGVADSLTRVPDADPLGFLKRRRACTVLFISDVGNCAIRYANFRSRLVRTVAGIDGVPGYRDGSCVSSLLRGATAMAWCSAGLLFTDGANGVLRLITHIHDPATADPQRQRTSATLEQQQQQQQHHGETPITEAKSTTATPRVWTLAGCAQTTNTPHHSPDTTTTTAYVDAATPSRAHFGFLSDMAVQTDEAGNAQVLLLDQTHHAVRVVDAEAGVATYVGPLDYDVATKSSSLALANPVADALPSGLVHPCSMVLTALVKERAPTLLDSAMSRSAAAASAPAMLSPQPYLYSATPALFIASGITGAVSLLLPVSQRGSQLPWNLDEKEEDKKGESMQQVVEDALTLGIATEGRRTMGEAATPSLRRVVLGWNTTDEQDYHAHVGPDGDGSAAIVAAAENALGYLRLCFPWLLPPAVPHLSKRLVSLCSCHLSGKQRPTDRVSHHNGSVALPLSSDRIGGGHVGGSRSKLPRPCLTYAQEGEEKVGNKDNARADSATSPVQPSMLPQQLLFRTPPRHPVRADSRIAAVVKAVAALIDGPHIVERTEADEEAMEEERKRKPDEEQTAVRPTTTAEQQDSPSPVPLHVDAVEDTAHDDVTEEQQQQQRRGPTAKWLTPPAKSLSRSPGSTPRRIKGDAATYTDQFKQWPAEQRQQRLARTLGTEREEEKQEEGEARSPSASPLPSHRHQRRASSASHSPRTSTSRGSPTLTPRSMAAHQLMQRRHSSRSTTAPHIASVGSTAVGADGKPARDAADEDPEGRRRRSADEGEEGVQQQSPRSPSHRVHEAGEDTARALMLADAGAAVDTSGTGEEEGDAEVVDSGVKMPARRSRGKAGVHDAYDAAVRQLFRVYAYFATCTVTPTTTATTTTTAAASQATVREVEHYSMTFSAFHRFLTLTGYLDFMAEVASTAVGANHQGEEGKRTKTEGLSAGLYTSAWWYRCCRHLTQVQRRTGHARQGQRTTPQNHVRRATSTSSSFPSAFAAQPATMTASASASPLLLPLSAADARVIAELIYDCGVHQQGYHVLSKMDFQAFRRAALLLHTWTRTAVERSVSAAARELRACAYLDLLPSLDALSSEEVMAAYRSVAAQAVRTVPALQGVFVGEARRVAARAPSASKNPAARGLADAAVVGCSPPVSPITAAMEGTDFSALLDGSPASSAVIPVASVASPRSHSSSPKIATADADDDAQEPFPLPALTPEARLALDDVLRLLQRNEPTLRQIFNAYAMRVEVCRSAGYIAPRSAAAAADASHSCSILSSDGHVSAQTGSRPPSTVGRGGVGAAHRKEDKRATTAAAGVKKAASPVTPLSSLLSRLPCDRQDVWWKLHQLYTMTAWESSAMQTRAAMAMFVVPYRAFVELWRAVDVFPSLMTVIAMQQAYLDALTTPLLCATSQSKKEKEHDVDVRTTTTKATAAPEASVDSPHRPMPKKSEMEAEELLLAHTGLPYAAFVEAVVRVGLTVFSHDVDSVAYPTCAAKTAGLMQWINKQVSLGFVEQRAAAQRRNTSAAVLTAKKGVPHGSALAGSWCIGMGESRGSPASALSATRGHRGLGEFPERLQLFHVPSSAATRSKKK